MKFPANLKMSSHIIFLLGFMGSGKSTIGTLLAKELGYEFQDLDEIIEKQEGQRIKDIFNDRGEQVFRTLEKEALFSLGKEKHIVIALGGGTPCSDENITFISEYGISIYLDVSTKQLATRLYKGISTRPLLKGLNTLQKLENFINTKLRARVKYYKQADFDIDANHDPILVVSEIMNKLSLTK